MFNIKQTCTTPLKTPLKRKKLSLKPNELKDEEFMSPVKRRPKMSSIQSSSCSSSSTQLILQRPPKIDFTSPLKNWQGFLSSPCSSSNATTSSLNNYLKTPSPARMLRRPVVCKNIGNLLMMTPEKDSEEEEERRRI
ncbi:hypothetical protein Mgra_00005670 [Meloidogyne graminicola]|uniref:Uncharacterized protein n=1 Tax=Meloidogyne graminicola TaxID=189291 RepID=A0A8S9ZPB9_9BILA|nr:hypothetical protein Mgra_00005670 [Meloidogyne graminicola]